MILSSKAISVATLDSSGKISSNSNQVFYFVIFRWHIANALTVAKINSSIHSFFPHYDSWFISQHFLSPPLPSPSDWHEWHSDPLWAPRSAELTHFTSTDCQLFLSVTVITSFFMLFLPRIPFGFFTFYPKIKSTLSSNLCYWSTDLSPLGGSLYFAYQQKFSRCR